MSLYAPSSPHFHNDNTVTKVMLKVLLALVPGILTYIIIFGFGVVYNILLAMITAVVCEALMLSLRKRPLLPFLSDGSALVTGVLLALSIPPIAPWWIIFLGTVFAIVIAKQLYGGLGYNPFNPAMVGYAMLLISFPLQMTTWALPITISDNYLGPMDSLNIFLGNTHVFDGISGATPLDYLKTQLKLGMTAAQIVHDKAFGVFAGTGFEWVNVAFFVGGIYLIREKIISWHIPLAMLGGLFAISLIFFGIDKSQFASPIFHVFSGAAILGAFFIATDPVSAATTPVGRVIYGAGIGILVYVIRTWGGYPDGVAFAVLLFNLCAPTIDYLTKPKPYGHE